jgi:hypothetical protein
MITYTGSRIEPLSKFDGKYNATPNIIDIALGLSRMPRFGGQTRRWWSVLLHSIVCCELAIAKTGGKDRRRIMLALLHDAHEAITADVPAFFKPKELKMWQAEIDERFFKSLNLWPLSEDDETFIKEIDDEALRAEALCLGPPTIMQHLSLPNNNSFARVIQIAARFPDAASSEGLGSKAVMEFLDRFSEMYRDIMGDNVVDDTPSNQPVLTIS